ncbi:AMP-binding protein, partial [Chloroflexota bacterium]
MWGLIFLHSVDDTNKPADYLDLNARDFPEKEALVDSRTRLTFHQAKLQSDLLALALIRKGPGKGHVVLVQLPNVVEDYIVRSALPKAGLVGLYMTMNIRHTEIEYAVKQTEAAAVITIAESHSFDYYHMFQEIQSICPSLKHIFIVGNQIPHDAVSISKMIEQAIDEKYPFNLLNEFKIQPGELLTLKMTSGTTGIPKLVASVRHS